MAGYGGGGDKASARLCLLCISRILYSLWNLDIQASPGSLWLANFYLYLSENRRAVTDFRLQPGNKRILSLSSLISLFSLSATSGLFIFVRPGMQYVGLIQGLLNLSLCTLFFNIFGSGIIY